MVLALVVGLAAWALLLLNTAVGRGDYDLGDRAATRRFWEDVSIAAAAYTFREDPQAQSVEIGGFEGQQLRGDYQRYLTNRAATEGATAWSPWRTLPLKPYLSRYRIHGRPSDDSGRALLLQAGFVLLGGVSPFLPLWLGAVVALPLLLWAVVEFALADRLLAGVVFGLSVVSFPFVSDVLSLPYSASGFYLLGLLALVPMATYAVLGSSPSVWPLVLRAGFAGMCVAVCALCRSGTLLLAPGYCLALALASRRVYPRGLRWVWCSVVVSVVLLAPWFCVRPSGHHEVWLGMWEGLGDYDRTKGHVWDDRVAREVLRRHGVAAPLGPPVWDEAMAKEDLWRRLVLMSVREDPLWYMGILVQRTLGTLSFHRLWPRGSLALSGSPNEGVLSDYYGMTTTADWLGCAAWRVELPVWVVLLPTVLLAASAAWRPSVASRELLVVGCVVLAGLTLPVLVTTAGAHEPQAFLLVYLLGGAFAVDRAAALVRSGREG